MPEISRNRQNARYAEDVVNVKDFGAVGDGVTDDTAAIQAAQDYLEALGGGKLVFPDTGNPYQITNLTIDSNYIEWEGQGQHVILRSTATTGSAITISKNVITLRNIRVTASAARTSGAGDGIYIDAGESFTQNRVNLIDCQVEDQAGDGIVGIKAENFRFENIWVERCGGRGFYFDDDGANIGIGCEFVNCRAYECTGVGWQISQQLGFTFINCQSLKNGGAQEVFFQAGSGHQWINGDIERTTVSGVGLLTSASFTTIIGGTIQKLADGIEVNSTSNVHVINPRLVGDATTPMTTGVKSVSSTGVNVYLQESPANVTTPISDSVNARITHYLEGRAYNLDVRPRRETISSSASISIDANSGYYKEIQSLATNTTINAPTNANIGDEVTITIVQDATGGRTVSWNGAYVFSTAWSDTGNTSNTRSTVKFVYNGVDWRQIGTQSAYA